MMERISAACAMEWSIELEKGLRSKKPGQPIEAILQIGPRLEKWSKEPISTMAISNIFGLVPGEERLFANTILLRLADAFKSGDKPMRVAILKAFLLERRQHKKGKQYKGILSKQRVPNYLELLKRVKIVYDTGDAESRGITLRLLGCWSDIAKDSADIRHMVLLSLGSCRVLEAKAAIFTAGCFSELSEDFAYIFLEVLINMVTSSKTSITVKLACAKAFAKVGSSLTLATRAYKAGRKLVLNASQEEIFILEMLISLSKLASKSTQLVSEHVEMLLSFITSNSVQRVQATTVRCMLFLLGGGVSRFPINASLLAQLFLVMGNINLPTVAQCETLQILLKIIRSTQLSLSCIEMTEIVMWVSMVESATRSPVISKRLLALHLLVDLSFKCRKEVKTVPDGNGSTDFASRLLLLLLDQITQLAKPVLNPCEPAFELTQEFESVLSLVLRVVQEDPTLGGLALNKISSCIESLVNVGKGGTGENAGSSSQGEKQCSVASQFVFCMFKFVEHCLEALNEASAVTAEAHHSVKLVVEILHKSYFLNHDMFTRHLILLHSRVMWSYLANDSKEFPDAENLGTYWIEHERLTREFIEKTMAGHDKWAAYKAGKCAAQQGSWFAAAFTFMQLINSVQSNVCQHWLKSLALFAQSESKIMLLFLPIQGQELVSWSQIDEIWATRYWLLGENAEGASCDSVLWEYFKNFSEAHSDVCSAVKLLAAAVTTDHNFIFQTWFLNLRVKVLEVVVDILILLNSNSSNENTGKVEQVDGCTSVGRKEAALDPHPLAHSFTLVSLRLNRLAQELDLLATSFMDMDLQSYRTISRLALSCSLFAFCTGFALYFPSPNSPGNSMYWGVEDFNKGSRSMLIQDLANRLWHIDSAMGKDLERVLTLVGEPNSCHHIPPGVPVYKAGQREKETIDVCKYALSEFLCIIEQAKGTKSEEGMYLEPRTRLQLLSSVLKRWMNMSFQVPKYFFQVRSCIGAELFVFNADSGNTNELSVFAGSHLSLNLCLQLKHVPPGRVTKLYCILASKPSYWTPAHGVVETKEKMWSGFQPADVNDTMDLNEKLWMHVTEGAKRSGRKLGKVCSGDGLVCSCVSFVLNESGQGFSTCLLDVSSFPVGCYKIKWHSCCIDSKDSYWSLVPLNMGPVFSVRKDSVTG